jgi:hypothetical protein
VRFTSIPSYANDSSYDCSRIPITIQSHAIPCHDTSKRNEAYHIFSFPLYFPLLFLAWAGVKVLHTHTHTHTGKDFRHMHACTHSFTHGQVRHSSILSSVSLSRCRSKSPAACSNAEKIHQGRPFLLEILAASSNQQAVFPTTTFMDDRDELAVSCSRDSTTDYSLVLRLRPRMQALYKIISDTPRSTHNQE